MIHLHVHTPYSFLDGASDIESLVRAAASFGMPALAMTDHNSAAAAVKFTAACEGYGIKPILGTELTLEDDTHLTLLAESRAGYANLCTLVSLAFAHGGRLSPKLPWSLVEAHALGLFCLSGCRKGVVPSLIRAHRYEEAERAARNLQHWFGAERFYLELQEDADPDSHRVCGELAQLGDYIGAPVVATNNVHYVRQEDFITHDTLRAIGTLTKKEEIHPDRPLNSQRYLKSAAEMERLFAWRPDAVANTLRIAEQCGPALPGADEITPRYPVKEGFDAPGYLRHLTFKGAKARYKTLDRAVVDRLNHELNVIVEMGFADYFLMVWEIVRWARKNGIRATGRGSAADSCVAYSLFLTDVDVIARKLPFARFLTRGKTPDIDVDFPSERRDDVFRYIVQKYGEAHVGMVCVFHTFWARSAVRDVGKALGLPPDALEILTERLSGFVRADKIDEAFERFAELKAYTGYKERFRLLFTLCARIAGFPRHLGTHSSGIVISRVPLATIAPLSPSARGVTQIWTLDKDDAEVVGAIKFDVLSLRMLSAIGDAERELAESDPLFRYERIPTDDPATYHMIRSGNAIGAFQFESAAQMALATVLHPQHFEDMVASVALIRPGPIRGNGVARFVAARNGWSRSDILHPSLAPYLTKTYGVIIFQEQVTQVTAAITGCSDADADRFRKSLLRHHKLGTMDEAREEFVTKALRRHADLTPEAADLLFEQIAGWAGYGFIEGHAAAFALTGIKSAYLSVHHPAEFFAGMMNHQPMGFYSANTLAAEARRRGVTILPVDINQSADKCRPLPAEVVACRESVRPSPQKAGERGESATLPYPPALSPAGGRGGEDIRLGLRLVAELREEDIAAIVQARRERPFASLLDFCARVPIHRDRLENLVLCGAFDSLHPHRRGLLWRLEETIGMALSYREPPPRNTLCAPLPCTPLPPKSRGEGSENHASPDSAIKAATEGDTVGHGDTYDDRQDPHNKSPLSPAFWGEGRTGSRCAITLRGGGSLDFGPVSEVETPVAWEIDDFSPWQRFTWTWRLNGVCADCHPLAHFREGLERWKVITCHEAREAKHGTEVTVAGLNIRPHRPPTRSGKPVLFGSLEDETDLLQMITFGEPLEKYTGLFLTAPAVLVRGVIERRGSGATLHVEKARLLRAEELARYVPALSDEPERNLAVIPNRVTLPTGQVVIPREQTARVPAFMAVC